MDYLEYAPSAALRQYVHCYWTLRIGGTQAVGREEAIFPDGRPELVFHLGDPFVELGAGVRQARALLVGQMVHPVRLRATGSVEVFGIRLQPAACRSVTAVAPGELAGKIADTYLVCKAARAELWHALADCQTGPQRVGLAERWLLSRIRSAVDPVAEVVAAALRLGRPLPDCGLSTRQIRRRFSDATGIAPALFSRIARFQRALGHMRRHPLALTAAEAGYADQSHLTREFREFAGCTPREYLTQAGLSHEFVESPFGEDPCPFPSRHAQPMTAE
jgi:AraC-like DNA-binding protein